MTETKETMLGLIPAESGWEAMEPTFDYTGKKDRRPSPFARYRLADRGRTRRGRNLGLCLTGDRGDR